MPASITHPSPPSSFVQRRARSQRPTFFARHLFRHSSRRRHSTMETFPNSDQDAAPNADQQPHSTGFLQRHAPGRSNPASTSASHPKPIYIYPGLLRIVRDKAIALDNQCPAVLYKCRECRREGKLAAAAASAENPNGDKNLPDSNNHHQLHDLNHPPSTNVEDNHPEFQKEEPHKCPHATACPICLEEFHSKDLVRKLPCNANHIFHSKCILDWFISHPRCPLCNEPVANSIAQNRLSPRGAEETRRTGSNRTGIVVMPAEPASHGHLQLHRRGRDLSYNQQPRSASYSVREQSRRNLSLHEGRGDGSEARQRFTQGDKGRRRNRGPRTYSYIVHDNVRMEMNPIIPV